MADTPPSNNGLQHLRWFAESLMRDAELPDRQVTVMHRDLFRRAGIQWRDGQDLVELLASLDLQQLSSLISQLRDVDDDEEE
ncbi:TPA: hypothetical protein ACXN3R_001000 [Stenotrophomonas maltophilia]|uniref:hypothetical protein n=1 Tax=Stenotrophomonas maltophilia TaxID=40324 RepID=UPI0013DB006E|nr:hypothetical protein [Stenotrophomonas maltophilia]MDT3474758.1 hypothetical protein [Stenotrophomonas maltophilia]